ncbi:MAG: Ribokinase [Caldanaerobacter subterraneus]|uniref:Ribokinase n=1 Tax=Caldanaerobacter subterraneus TaxID=911092 RepID=A0A101E5B9_9THEO|nr:ribokinase [Caldanaerobacter subterraneus]KUK08902.1 MAG: Ribokinase [Caldanaerobacter subterraneus]HBT50236.1 ribokinase [Caldanaerobacter subterraneus]
MKIAVVGSINKDYTAQVDKLPQKGETVIASNYKISLGGKGANQAVAAKRLGAEVAMIGAVGKLDGGQDIVKKLENDGIDVSGILIVDDEVTGNAMITVDEKGANTIVVYPGANNKLSPLWIEKQKEIIRNAHFAILQLEIPIETVEFAVKISKEYNVKVILNPAPAKKLPEEIYEYVDIITPNEVELTQLTGTEDIKEGASILIQKGVKEVIVTLGERGCYYTDGIREIFVEAVRVKAIDTTAAGDAFNAAIAVALGEKMDINSALIFANIAGALTTTKMGAQDALPFRQEVESFKKNLVFG